MRVLQVDPGLFTAPYDAGLTRGLEAAGVEVVWAARAPRSMEKTELDGSRILPLYYRGQEASVKRASTLPKVRKGLSHVASSRRLMQATARQAFDVVHLQWPLLPAVDAWMVRRLTRSTPVVLTLHDLKPFNDSATSRVQRWGLRSVLESASAIIVHTEGARTSLLSEGFDPKQIHRIPHGPLGRGGRLGAPGLHGGAWTIVLAGKLQTYKGLDVLIEAAASLTREERLALRIIVAGEALMDLKPLRDRLREEALERVIEIRPGRLSEADLDVLMSSADAFVFPYRHIEASGMLYLALPYERWIIASALGAFRELIDPGRNGALIPPGDANELGRALVESVNRMPDVSQLDKVMDWDEIGLRTRAVYEGLCRARV